MILLICRGEIIIKMVDENNNEKKIRKLVIGDVWYGGELEDPEIKKIIIHSSAKASVMQLRFSDLYYQVEYRRIQSKLLNNIQGASLVSLEQPKSQHHHALWLFNQDELEQRIIGIRYFVSAILLLLCCYIFSLQVIQKIVAEHKGDSFSVSIIMLIICMVTYIGLIRNTHFPPAVMGLSLANTRLAVKEALLGTIPLLLIGIATKWLLITVVPSLHGESVIDMKAVFQIEGNAWNYYGGMISYAFLSVPLQELIIRGGVQGCLEQIYSGSKSMWTPILVANMIFATVHVMISPLVAAFVFFPGLYWGWLFARHNNLIGVCLSHAIYGICAYFLIGYIDIIK